MEYDGFTPYFGFVLAFKDEDEWDDFLQECKRKEQHELLNFIANSRNLQDEGYKEEHCDEILEFLRKVKSLELEEAYLRSHPCAYEDTPDVRRSYACQHSVRKGLKEPSFLQQVERVQEAEIVIFEKILNSDKSLLAFALRCDYLQHSSAWPYLVAQVCRT